jgi:hypothetical protein
MAPVGFKLTVSAGERPQTYGAVTGTGCLSYQDGLLKDKRICKTIIRRGATYGVEYWTVKKDIAKLLAAFKTNV